MREVKDYCDHCGKEIDWKTDYCGLDVGFFDCLTVDLCNKCASELEEQIARFVKRSDNNGE